MKDGITEAENFFEVIRILEGDAVTARDTTGKRERGRSTVVFSPSHPFIFCPTLARHTRKVKAKGAREMWFYLK